MNVALVDHLACPRCGPPFGLVLLARDVRDRRVRTGEFGCPNCRDRFPVEGGFGDLRPPPRAGGGAGAGGGDAEAGRPGAGTAGGSDAAEKALRLAAALGVTSGPGLILVTDGHRDEAGPLARLVRGIEVVVVGWRGRGLAGEGVSAFVTGPRLPLRDGVARGAVAEGGSGGEGWWGECLRTVTPGGRIVITGATQEAREWVAKAGLATALDEGGVVAGGVAAGGGGARMGRWAGREPDRGP
ncbi:MAG: hypothetical protein OXU64_06700 [Gemmatimonadota bacterium]|nr:hypothetical protein [Gemmatimonadota bacterium]